MMIMSSGEIRDPIHGYIYMTPVEKELIDSRPVQRLRRIKQLSGAFLTYPGAEHSRFSHSLGVMHLAGILGTHFANMSYIDEEDVQKIRIAGLLHDIGNQLQLILAGGDFLEKDSPPEQIMRSKRYVMDGALRCLELIQKVRKAEESKTEPLKSMDIIRVINAESELLFKQRGVRVDIGKLPPKLNVLADQAVSQLVWNLLENAVVHNPKEDAKKIVKVRGKVSGKTFKLSISDNGAGITDDKKPELFEPTRRYGGVGLHLVRRLAEKYGSTPVVKDRVKGKPDQGAEIVVTFQLA